MDESEQLTDQQLYDKVKAHLLAQGRKSESDDGEVVCLYRGPGGTRCAAGVLIDDAHYDPVIEGDGVSADMVIEALLKSGVRRDQIGLVTELQLVHDDSDPQEWSRALAECAEQNGLQP